MIADRAALRRELRVRRRAVTTAERLAAAEQLAAQLLSCTPSHGYVAGYWAMDGEIALHAWQLRLPAAVSYCLPVLHDDGCLRFAPWRVGEPLLANRYGIPEPQLAATSLIEAENMAMIVLPLVAFDALGQRLGMGAGWYDRTLAFRRNRIAPPLLVGAAFAMQQVTTLPSEAWDVPLDAVCTEHGTLHLAETA